VESEIGRIVVQGQHRQKVHKTPPSQSIAGHSTASVSSNYSGTYRKKELGPSQPRHKSKTIFQKQPIQKGLMERLKG
jgi:hypothetical protein